MDQPKTGRKRLVLDAEQIERLAAINCTNEEIAAVLNCSADTLVRRYADRIKKGKDLGKSSLRRKMWEAAQAGSIPMMIFLSKNLLGYADKVEQADPGQFERVFKMQYHRKNKPEA